MVLVMETLGEKYRTKVGILFQGWFAVGATILSAVAYFIRDHNYIQIYISLCAACLLPFWW